MATSLGVGLSVASDPAAAAREALERSGRGSAGGELVLLFLTEEYDPEAVLGAVRAACPGAPVLGFTAAGLVSGGEVRERGVLVAVLASDEVAVHLDAEPGLSGDQRRAGKALGRRLAERLVASEGEALLLVLADCSSHTLSGLVSSLTDELGGRVKYAGGGAGDQLRALRVCQLAGDRVWRDAAAAGLLICGKPFGVALAHGWRPFSPPFVVTRAEGNTLRELDWESAGATYAQALAEYDPQAAARVVAGGFAEVAMRYPLGVPQAREGERYVIRDPIRADEDGSLTCLGDVPENSVVRVMTSDRRDMLAAAREAAAEARAQLGPYSAAGVLVFYCVSRRLLLGEACREELAAVAATFGPGVPVFGCLSFGEVGAVRGGLPAFHNKSLVVCAFPR